MLEKARVARAKREHERAESEALEERQRAKQLHFMKCPKCGHDLAWRRAALGRCEGNNRLQNWFEQLTPGPRVD